MEGIDEVEIMCRQSQDRVLVEPLMPRKRRPLLARTAVLLLLAAGLTGLSSAPPAAADPGGDGLAPAPALHVSGNRLVTESGATYRLLGVNRSGGEFSCIQGRGMWDGPMDQASVTAMRSWKVRAVRLPLNEECWLGTAGVPAGGTSGTAYQQAVTDYVNLLVANGINPILELHWTWGRYTSFAAGCWDDKATCQKPMPDMKYTPAFWTSVADAFKGNNAVLFDLFNEPYPDWASLMLDKPGAWRCWRDGGRCFGIGYEVAGFQTLVNTVRSTGATNVILLSGLRYANDMRQWLRYKPTDPTGNLAAAAHVYNFNDCRTISCYNNELAPVAAAVPLIITEIGQNDCGHGFIDSLMSWADALGIGYLGWTWNTWDCSKGPALIADHNGTPTDFGVGLKNHLTQLP
jgi:endoglucanase